MEIRTLNIPLAGCLGIRHFLYVNKYFRTRYLEYNYAKKLLIHVHIIEMIQIK